MKNSVQNVVVRSSRFVARHAKSVWVAGVLACGSAVASAQTDATVIATNAQTAFAVIAPITITIVGFYVILRLAKRTVK